MNLFSPSPSTPSLPPQIRLRMGTEADEFATFEVMCRAMHIEAVWEPHRRLRNHLRTSDGACFYVAEEIVRGGRAKPKIAGYARSIVRDGVWMLTEFFLLPEFQHRGIGKALLTQVLASSEIYGAKRRLVLASQHPSADALYIRYADCAPRLPMFLLTGSPKRLRLPGNEADSILDADDEFTPYRQRPRFLAEPPVLTETLLQELERLDRESLGFARPQEHRYWLDDITQANRNSPDEVGTARVFRRLDERGTAGELVGYAYASRYSNGPVCASEREWCPRFFAHVVGRTEATRKRHFDFGFLDSSEVYAAVPGTNAVMLQWLLGCGWRISSQFLLMSNFAPNNLEGYVGHCPISLL